MQTEVLIALITSLLTFAGVVILALNQYRMNKTQAGLNEASAYKLQSDVVQTLIERALALNKQELDTIKMVNEELRTQVKDQSVIIEGHVLEIARLENVIMGLEKDFRECKKKLGLM
jgi:hypothetical protein